MRPQSAAPLINVTLPRRFWSGPKTRGDVTARTHFTTYRSRLVTTHVSRSTECGGTFLAASSRELEVGMRRVGVGFVMLSLFGACGGSGGGSSGAPGDPDGGAGLVVRPPPAFAVHDDTQLHQAELTMSADDWQSIIDDSRGDVLRHATLTYDGVAIDDVGVHPSGESSRFSGNQKQSFRVKFDAFGHGKFAGLKEINIKGEYDDH